jgi:hypothetical protein
MGLTRKVAGMMMLGGASRDAGRKLPGTEGGSPCRGAC